MARLDQKQIRSSSPGQTKKMTNVFKNVIAILTINGKGGVVGSLAIGKKNHPLFFVCSRACMLRCDGVPVTDKACIGPQNIPCGPFSRRHAAMAQRSRERRSSGKPLT
jgi:hypothetical protein